MVSASAAFPGRPFNLRSEVWVVSQDTNPSAPSSLVGWQPWIDKTGYSPTWSGGAANRSFVIDGTLRGEDYTPGFDFRAGGPWLVLSGQSRIAHNPDGTKRIGNTGGADYALLGAAQVNSWLDLPPIATYGPPNAPVGGNIDQITKTSFVYHFVYCGGVIGDYTVQIATRSDFSDASSHNTIDGTVPFTGLKPGTEYFCRTRANNDRGSSPWGAQASARTRSGAWISDGTAWKPADVFISDGTAWKPADVLISDGTQWKPTA